MRSRIVPAAVGTAKPGYPSDAIVEIGSDVTAGKSVECNSVAAYNLAQAELRLPWTGPQMMPVQKRLSFSGSASVTAVAVAISPEWYRLMDLRGNPTFAHIPAGWTGAQQWGARKRLTVVFDTGQSLATSVVGASSQGNYAWESRLPWAAGTSVDPRILSFSNASMGETGLSGEVFQEAVSDFAGGLVGDIPHHTRTGAPQILRALQILQSEHPIPNIGDILVSEHAKGGKRIEYFMSTASGGEGTHWDNVLVPSWNHIKAQADANGYTVDRLIVNWNQHEANHTDGTSFAQYQALFDALVADLEALRTTVFGAGCELYIMTAGACRIYESVTLGQLAGSDTHRMSEPRRVQIEAGLSDDPKYANVYCAPPTYALAFSGISHMTAEGYEDERSQSGHFTAYAIWMREVLGKKAKPMHAEAVNLLAGGTQVEILWHLPDYARGLNQDAANDPGPYTGLPDIRDAGFTLHGGNMPAIATVETDAFRRRTVLTLQSAWTGTERAVGIAYEDTSGETYDDRMQGWTTPDKLPFDPGEEEIWVHNSIGCNVHAHVGAMNLSTLRALPMYPAHQLVAVA